MPVASALVGEIGQDHRVRDDDADQHDHAHHRLDVDGRVGEKEHPEHADESHGTVARISSGSTKDLSWATMSRKISTSDKNHADAHAAERDAHRVDLADPLS